MARRGFQLKSHFRYLGAPYAGELRYEYLPDDPIFGSTRTGLSWQHTQTLRPGTDGASRLQPASPTTAISSTWRAR